MAEHRTNPSCATCHKLIDPIGFGFEKFDAIGRRRDKFKLQFRDGARADAGQEDRVPVELPLDTQRHASPAFRIRSSLRPRNLGRVLAESPQCQECMVKQYFRYADGRHGNARRPPGHSKQIV